MEGHEKMKFTADEWGDKTTGLEWGGWGLDLKWAVKVFRNSLGGTGNKKGLKMTAKW